MPAEQPQSATVGTGVDRRAMATLSAGHLFTDVAQGSVPALLPFLIVKDHLSYAGASALILAATIASSVIQPVFGHLSDRRSLPWLMPLGPVLGGVGVALAAIAPTYGLTFAAVVVSGIGVAAFHPEGSRFANYVSGARRSSGMSLFSVGGNVGFALGPALVTPLVLAFGLSGALLVIVPTSLMGLVLARELPRLKTFRVDLATSRAATTQTDAWRPFTLLAGVIALRSFVYFGFITFIPLYFIHDLHTSRGTAGAALTVMLAGGAIGTLVGGQLADRFGRRSVLIGSMAVLPFLTVAFLISPPALAMLFAAFAGATTIATFAVTIVMGQEFLPGRIGVASGVTIGLSVGMGGVAAPLLGILADAQGLRAVFEVMVVFPLAALALSLALPVRRDPGHAAARAATPSARARAHAPTQTQRSPA
jgi:MFS transporter, FSR family, fosmidomycin resistance protein